MFSKRALGAGLATAALLTGCGTETVGSSFVTPNHECIEGKSTLRLASQQDVYIGGDLKIGGDDADAGINDSFKLSNAGRGVLEVVRSSGDEGTVSFPSNGAQVAPNHQDNFNDSPPSTDFTFDLSKIGSIDFNYGENTATFVIDATVEQGNPSIIDLHIDMTCAPTP